MSGSPLRISPLSDSIIIIWLINLHLADISCMINETGHILAKVFVLYRDHMMRKIYESLCDSVSSLAADHVIVYPDTSVGFLGLAPTENFIFAYYRTRFLSALLQS